jgi:hypothetical protein
MSSSNFFSSHNARRPSKYSGVAGVTPPSPCTPSIRMATVAGEIAAARRCQIVEGNVPEARRHRLETFFHLVLARGGNARQRAAVKRIRRRENFEPALVVAKFPRQLIQTFIRLRAAVGKKAFARPMRLTISAASRPCGSVKYKLETWMSFFDCSTSASVMAGCAWPRQHTAMPLPRSRYAFAPDIKQHSCPAPWLNTSSKRP